jgi:UDP-GlcNAc3NAcA epimerase
LSRAVRDYFSNQIHEIIVHTGQHYDHNMSDVFINELGIPKPDYNLGIGSSSHGKQTAAMIDGIEEILLKEKPQWCVLFGDTNSTLAGAIAASKMNVAVAHIEAGLRSFDKTMPEELNRIACDHFSTVLFAPTTTAVQNLKNEGFAIENKSPYHISNPAVVHSGDVMYDNTLFFASVAAKNTSILQKLNPNNEKFALCTIHRPHNTDNPKRLSEILRAILQLSQETHLKFIIPLHPRTAKILQDSGYGDLSLELEKNNRITFSAPVSFLEMTALEENSTIIITDSGGVQKESYFMKKPCVILRNETEWVEIIHEKTGVLADANASKIIDGVKYFLKNPPLVFPSHYGNGNAAKEICQWLVDNRNNT